MWSLMYLIFVEGYVRVIIGSRTRGYIPSNESSSRTIHIVHAKYAGALFPKVNSGAGFTSPNSACTSVQNRSRFEFLSKLLATKKRFCPDSRLHEGR